MKAGVVYEWSCLIVSLSGSAIEARLLISITTSSARSIFPSHQ